MSNQRPIDKLLSQNFSTLTRQVKLVRKVKIKAWKAFGIITFIAGFSAALVWSISQEMVTPGFLQQAPTTVSNQAQVTFEDEQGNQYGPVTSNIVSTEIVQAQTCQDNTPYNQCSRNKPKYCQAGTLIDDCSQCGCPGNQVCQADGTCQTSTQSPRPFNFKHKIQGKKRYRKRVTIKIYLPGTNNLVCSNCEIEVETDDQGEAKGAKPPKRIPDGVYDLVIKVPHCLSKRLSNVTWPPDTELDFGETKVGNLNDEDDVINSLDWSVMNSRWGTADEVADINEDGVVNTLDWSLMNQNWGQEGE